MAALTFPAAPLVGDVYPADPGTSGVTQYRWDGSKWNAVTPSVSLGIANQGVFNQYQWPSTDGVNGRQLTTDGAGNLSWEVAAGTSFVLVSLFESFDGVQNAFTMVSPGTADPFIPFPTNNILVFLGGVPQIPVAAYTILGSTIIFAEPPEPGSSFYAISSAVV